MMRDDGRCVEKSVTRGALLVGSVLVVAFVITLFLREIPLGSRARTPIAAADGIGSNEVAA